MAKQNDDWKPDDSFHDLINGEFKGVLRVKEALKNLKIETGNRIITSKDADAINLIENLRRHHLPEGFEQWQLPFVFGGGNRPVMTFITIGNPNAVIPHHAHKNDLLFRIVISGSIIYNKIELTAGDWMHIPAGLAYSFKVGKLGSVTMHLYNGHDPD
jgi:hypothetical protein